ncbi:MAG: hypothetical protein LBU16_02440 [Treponema sp.]|jgi:hypothetical protein|nr:hypothetical protein [Treponema sp.]
MKKTACFFLVFGLLSASFAEDMEPLMVSSTRSLAMGGTHVAYTDDVYALFVNPAALQKANQGAAFEISPALVGPLFDMIDLANAIQGNAIVGLGNFAEKTGGKIPIGFDLRGPLSVGYTANGFGFGIWDRVHMDMEVIGTDIEAAVLTDLILNFGMSFSVLTLGDHDVDAGFVIKPFARVKAGMGVTALDAVGGGLNNIVEEFNVPLIAGAGFDLGFMYRFRKNLAAGMTIDDVYTGGGKVSTIFGKDDGVSSYRVPATLNLGAAYTLQPLSWLGFAFMLDYRDVTNLFSAGDYTKRNPILNLAFGTELSLVQFIKLRIGLNEMLPAAGFGIEAKAFQFNVAIYGKELSTEPGGFSTYGVDLSIAIRPETKEKEWPWSRPIVNTILEKRAPPRNEASGPVEIKARAPTPEEEAEAAAEGSLRRLDEALNEP